MSDSIGLFIHPVGPVHFIDAENDTVADDSSSEQ